MRPTTTRSLAAAAALSLLLHQGARADQILQLNSDSLTTYKATSSTAQHLLRPNVLQRGVGVDGSARASGGYAWAFAGNPFGDAVSPVYRVGDVSLVTGGYSPTDVDLALPAPGGARVVIGRTYNGRQETNAGAHVDSNGIQGYNWQQLSMPELRIATDADHSKDVVYLVYGADRYLEFQRTDSSSDYYQGRNGTAGVLKRVQVTDDDFGDDLDYFIYYDQNGTRTYFLGTLNLYNFSGQFWMIVDTAGNTTYVGDPSTPGLAIANGFDSYGHISTLYDAAGRRYTYTYSGSPIASNYRLQQVKAETKTGGTWASPSGLATVGQVDYGYYTSTTNDQGQAGDLKLVTVTTPLTDSGVNAIRKKNYWYYTRAWDNSSGRRGEAHEIKMVIGNEGYRQRDWADSDLTNDTPLSDSEATLKPYSDAYFEYADTSTSSKYRVSSAYFNGECGCSGGANGTYTIAYSSNGSYTDNSGYDTAWCQRAVVTQPDSSYCTYYFDEVGQPLSRVITNTDPSGSPTKTWVTGVVRDANGCVTEIHTPANVTGYTHNTGGSPDGTITYSSSVGLVNLFIRNSGTDVTGFIDSTKYKQGTGGTAYFLSRMTYNQQDFQAGTSVYVTRPVVETRRSYPGVTSTYSAAGTWVETDYVYDWWSVTDTDVLFLAMKQLTTYLPSVDTGNNGSGSSNTTDRYLRQDGTTAFSRAADDIWDYTAFTNGQLTKQVRDVVTSDSFPSGDDPNTDWGVTESGNGSDRTTLYSYDAQGRRSTTTLPNGRVTENYYSRLKDQRMVSIAWPRSVTSMGTTTRYGPASYSVANQSGKSECSGVIAITSSGLTDALTTWIDETTADPITAVTKGTLASMRTAVYSDTGHQLQEDRAYFNIPGSGAGSPGTEYDATQYAYDAMGRKWRTKTAPGTITRTVFDELGRAYQTYMGTNDHTFADGEAGGSDNMVKISELEFDSGSAGGNSLVTTRTAFIQDSTTGRRDTTYAYDFRGRVLLTTNPQAPHMLASYDNLGRMIASAQYASTGSITPGSTDPAHSGTQSDRVALSKTLYDEMGRVFKTTRYKVTQANGTDADSIDSLTWYDPAGRVIKVKGESAHEKRRYDRLGRLIQRFTLAKDNDAANTYSDVYSGTTSVAGDIVLVEDQTAYESTDSDNVLMRVSIARQNGDTLSGTTGELDLNADGGTPSLLTATAVDIKGRVQITCMWYDALDRVTDSLRLGTNGIVGDRSASTGTYARGSHGSAPTRSDVELVTTTAYNDNGTTLSVTDPRGLVTRYEYDALFRQTKVIRNYTDGTPGPADQDQTVEYGYTNGLRTSIAADLPSPATDQVTTYIYGTTKGTPSQSTIATGHLLRAVKYPDSGNAGTTVANIDSDSSDVVSYAYNAQGQATLTKDQAGNIIENDYDTAGRQTERRVTTLAGGFDGAVRRIETTYLSRGPTDKVTQYDNATVGSGSVTDEVEYAYDDWGNVASFTQDVDSAIGGSGRASFAISYTYEKATPSGGRTYLRRTGASYPGGSDLTYTYPGSPALNDAAGLVYEVKVGSVVTAWYDYRGAGDVVTVVLPEANMISINDLRDNFERPTESLWTRFAATPNTPATCDVQIAYDRDSNITSVVDLLHKNSSGDRNYDVIYTIDNLNRLTEALEGKWESDSLSPTSRDEQWTLDQVGNMTRVKLDLDGNGTFSGAGEMDDTRTYSVANELSTRDTDSTPGTTANNHTLSYDAVGNMTDDGKDYKYRWDAFGRLVEVDPQSGVIPVAAYTYNGLNYRIRTRTPTDYQSYGAGEDDGPPISWNPWYSFGYDERWRMINTYRDTDSSPKERFVYHAAGLGGYGGSSYIDSVILRDRDANTAWGSAADGTLEERRYYCQNWRADVSAVLTDTGKLVESVKYSSYGVPTCLPAGDLYGTGSWGSTESAAITAAIGGAYDVRYDTDLDGYITAYDVAQANAVSGGYQTIGRGTLSSPAVASRKGYAGYEGSAASAMVLSRRRWASVDLSCWLRRDSAGFHDSMSLYQYVSDNPLTSVDPEGLRTAAVDARSDPAGSILEHAAYHESTLPTTSRTGLLALSDSELSPIAAKFGGDCGGNCEWNLHVENCTAEPLGTLQGSKCPNWTAFVDFLSTNACSLFNDWSGGVRTFITCPSGVGGSCGCDHEHIKQRNSEPIDRDQPFTTDQLWWPPYTLPPPWTCTFVGTVKVHVDRVSFISECKHVVVGD
jgi:RHS repeat-associated protein